MLQSPPLASMLPFHHAMQVAAAQAQAAQDSFSSSNAVTSVGASTVPTSSPASGATVVSSIPHNGLVGPPHAPHAPPHAPPHPPFGHHPHAGLGGHAGPHHPHFHPHLGMEPPRPRFLFKMPRVVPNQKEKYESEDLMKRHSREGEVRFTGYRDRPLHERQTKFICALREGHTEIAFIATGFNLILTFDPTPAFNPAHRQCDYEKEPGKVHIRSPFILNGVCCRWKGYMDLERLDGVGCIEFDEDAATLEDAIMRDTVEAYNRRIKDFEEHQKARSRQLAAFMGHQQQVAAALQAHQQLQANASSNSTSSTNTTASSSSSNNTNSVGTTVSSSTQPPLVTSPTNNNLISTTTTTSSANNSPSSLVNHSHFVASSHTDIFEARKKLHELSSNPPPSSTAAKT